MPSLPRIALITPSFNTGRHLADAVRSVLSQDYPNLDYLVMDGGSTDQTLDVLRSFGDRIRWISQKDEGQSDAIRKGFEQTTGEILGWLNADDVLAPGALRAVGEFFATNPDVALVYGNGAYIDAEGRLIGPCAHIEPFSTDRLFQYSDFIVQPAAFFRRSAYDAVGGLDAGLHYGMDYDLWLKLARGHKVVHIPQCLASYRWLTDNKTAVGGFRRLNELREMTARHGLVEPAFLRLERVNLLVREAITGLRRGAIACSMTSFVRANATLFGSPRAVRSLLQPHTWRVIWMGQVLRARAARAQKRRERERDRLVTKVTSPAKRGG
ncbi:MAG TPA: glycosyltransferase family 2 protein [Tepidisphaeraceae bacterium]|jgi:glycosyltransferase involved in cell wall biosynthesis